MKRTIAVILSLVALGQFNAFAVDNDAFEKMKTKNRGDVIRIGTNDTIVIYIYNVPEMKSICVSTFSRTNSSHQMDCKTYKEIGEK